MQNQPFEVYISRGPSREELRDSVGSKPKFRIWVTFILYRSEAKRKVLVNRYKFPDDSPDNVEVRGMINGYEWRDGSGESFRIKGQIKLIGQREAIPFEANYFTNNRNGYMFLQ